MQSQSPQHKMQGRKYASRRGVTFLESVLATVLLALVASSLAGGVSFMTRAQVRMDQRLGAAELGNRLILQYIDDRESLPDKALPIEYDIHLYRWSMNESKVSFLFDNIQDDDSGSVGSGASLSRIKLITVRVWLGEDSGGSRTYASDLPSCEITRLIDPLAFNNPDSLDTLINQPGGLERLFQSMMEDLGG